MPQLYRIHRIYLAIFVPLFTLLFFKHSLAQIPTEQDCLGAIPICDFIYTTPSSTFGMGNYPNEHSPTTCLLPGEQNSQWFIFTVVQSGDLAFTTFPVATGADYDWALYNITNATCADITTNASLQVSCNSSQWGITGISSTGVGNYNGPGFTNAFNYLWPVNAGETYVLNMNNWSFSTGGYTLDFTPSTAVIFDTVPPKLDTIESVICNQDQITFTFSEKILCNTVEDADFALTGPGGTYTLSGVTGAACAAGGNSEITFTIDVSPAITQGGDYFFHLTNNSGSVTDQCGNVADTMTLQFYVSSVEALLDSIVNPTCGGGNGEIYVSGNVGTPPYLFSIDGGAYQPNGTFTGLVDGTYFIVVKDSFNCDDTLEVTLVPATGAVDAVLISYNDINCFNACDGWIEVEGTGGVSPYSYAWTGGAGSTNVVTELCPDTYKVIITDFAGCYDSTEVTLIEPPEVHFEVTSIEDASCYGYKDGSVSLIVTGGTPPYSYQWSPYGGGNDTATGLGADTYALLVIDIHQCYYDTTIVITEPTPVEIIYPGDTTICFGTEGNLYAPVIGGHPPYSVAWDNGGLGNPYEVEPNTDDSYIAVAYDDSGCYSAQVEFIVRVMQKPVIELGNDTILCAGSVLFKDVFFPGAEYFWQDGSVFYDYTIKERGTYWVEAYNSCFTTIDTVVVDYDDCGTCVHVPNAFTPNSDGINDVFLPAIGCDFTDYSFSLFNRWGQLIFLTKDPGEGWDGLIENKPAEVGTYVWQVSYTGVQHNLSLSEKLKGSVILLR